MESERVVSLVDLTDEEARGVLVGTGDMQMDEKAVPKFVMHSYPAFRVEHAVVENDLVMHFFLPEGVDPKTMSSTALKEWETYWLRTFPERLNEVAQRYFGAGNERLAARYTEEVASWWFRGRGFGQSLDPSGLAEGFEKELSSSLASQST